MKKSFMWGITLWTIFLTTGCSPIVSKYKVTLDAITAPNIQLSPSSYTVKALDKNSNIESLRFQQQLIELHKILKNQGFKKVDNASLAEQTIYFDYGIEKILQETKTYAEPDISFGLSWGYPYGAYGYHYHPFWSDMGYYRSYRKTYNYYNRYITLLAKDKTQKELWRVDVSSIGESQNLKKIIPLLLEASELYLGKNTEEPIKLIIKEKKISKE